MADRYRLAAGVRVDAMRDDEIAVGNGTQLIAISGPSSLLVDLLAQFAAPHGARVDDALRTMPGETCLDGVTIRNSDFGDVLTFMVQNKILVDAARTTAVKYPVVHCVTRSDLQFFAPSPGDRADRIVRVDLRTTALDEALARMDGAEVVFAIGLREDELYRVNRVMLARKTTWLFCDWTSRRILVSPLLVPGNGPCYQCVRLRRLGALRDVRANLVLESQLVNGLAPAVVADAAITREIDFQISAILERRAAAPRAASADDAFFIVDSASGSVTPLPMTRLPDCTACALV